MKQNQTEQNRNRQTHTHIVRAIIFSFSLSLCPLFGACRDFVATFVDVIFALPSITVVLIIGNVLVWSSHCKNYSFSFALRTE